MNLPAEFKKNIQEAYGTEGVQWLIQLPVLLQTLSKKWNLLSIKPVSKLSFNFVAFVEFAEGPSAILKVGPKNADYSREILWAQSNPGISTKIYHQDAEYNAFFMEVIKPGEILARFVHDGQEDLATREMARLIGRLPYVKAASLKIPVPHLSTLIPSFKFLEGQIDKKLLEKGRGLFSELSTPSSDDVLLHGDLHHDNVISSEQGWKVIDAHGYTGDRESEPGVMIYNPLEWNPPSFKKALERKLSILFEELPFDAKRVHAWTFAKTMLSMAWNFEGSHKVDQRELAIAQALNEIKI